MFLVAYYSVFIILYSVLIICICRTNFKSFRDIYLKKEVKTFESCFNFALQQCTHASQN